MTKTLKKTPLNKIIRGETVDLPTEYGSYKTTPFIEFSNNSEHLALIKGTWEIDEPVLVRMHSSCVTGDIFNSLRCDCGEQLHRSMQMIEKEGKGIVIYLIQEGRGIGLFNKIHAYKLQENGLDTVEANLKLGFEPDLRNYEIGALILKELGARKVRLITNNPDKTDSLKKYGVDVVDTIPLTIKPNKHNQYYLETKKEKMGHKLELNKEMNEQINIEKQKNDIPKINWNKCESDGICVEKCPHDVLEMIEITQSQYSELSFFGKLRIKAHGKRKAASVNPENCQVCGICVKVCPHKAIKLVQI